MMEGRALLALCLVLTGWTVTCEGAKILGCPLTFVKNSALRNEEKILTMLAEHGHEVYILADSGYEPAKFVKEAGIKLITYRRPDELGSSAHRFALRQMTDDQIRTSMAAVHMPAMACEGFLNDSAVHDRLRKENFDLVYYTILLFCKYPIQGILGDVPSVEFMPFDSLSRFLTREMPLAPAYYPANMFPVGQDMTFLQRVGNHLATLLMSLGTFKMKFDVIQLAGKYNVETRKPESLGLVFGGFPLEYPAPYLPDIIYLNGILATQPKPLDRETEEFVNSSGDAGVIIMSFGSMISEYDEYYGNLIAEAFARMPQKVIWKFEGPTPKTLGKNTKLVKWMPQTGLLNHPKIKMFITHCGQNSMYETVMFGVPVVAMPLFGDQLQNSARLAYSHKVGVYVDLKTMTVDSLQEAMTEVASNPVYKENAVRLSSYLNDQPISGKELLLYWVDYVIRHKGISHLKPYGRFLPWYQYYSLDVVAFLLTVVSVICYVLCKCCMCTCRRCCKRDVKSKKD